ncbi:protein kinase superfamily protein isoform X3 [Tasmannia lanceolata]|uniref:protein kinase superfamily protein isoform X3 n=1 Tax=Tasmannia lanceolata TaxID=3420 RepID=UPI004063B512
MVLVGVLFPFPSPSLHRLSLAKPTLCFKPYVMAALSDDPIREWILTEGKATKITGISSIGGGCINLANRYDTDVGSFFVKTNRNIGISMFEGEAIGLNAMYATKSIRVPKPFKVGSLPLGGSFIIMEFIKFGSSRGNQSVLGRKLAEMHKAAKSDKGFGFDVDNTIGSTPQINTWSSDWVEFFAEHRLGYQLKLALEQYGDSIIYEKDGHNEAEFGMSWCAGFGGSFYTSYFEVMPKQPGFEKRRDLYMLYHYLNHYNLFGSGYRSSAMSIIDDYLRMLKI